MAIVYILSWWYTSGLRNQFARAAGSIASVFDYFSIDILLKTLFSPFRQISSGRVMGGLDVQFRAFVDRLVSRLVGATVRFFTILVGIMALVFATLGQALTLMMWMALPLVPLLGLVLTLGRWVPWSL